MDCSERPARTVAADADTGTGTHRQLCCSLLNRQATMGSATVNCGQLLLWGALLLAMPSLVAANQHTKTMDELIKAVAFKLDVPREAVLDHTRRYDWLGATGERGGWTGLSSWSRERSAAGEGAAVARPARAPRKCVLGFAAMPVSGREDGGGQVVLHRRPSIMLPVFSSSMCSTRCPASQ